MFTAALEISRDNAFYRSPKVFTVKGFTLIEIAVVLFIITLVMGGIAQYFSARIAAARIEATSSKQAAIKTALINFIARNNRLPCPAIPNLQAGNAGEGLEAQTTTTSACIGTTGSAANGSVFPIPDPLTTTPITATGEVPWQALGLSHEAALDGYANRFTYQVSWAATQLNSQNITGMYGVITLHSSGPGTYGTYSNSINPSGNQINDCRPNNLTVLYGSPPNLANPCAAVVVIVSHGVDGYGAYADDGGQQIPFPAQIAGTATDEQANADGDSKFVVKAYSGIYANPYDDAVLALTSRDVLAPLTNSGAIQDVRAVVNQNFNIIKSAIVGAVAQSRQPIASIVATPPGCGTYPTPPTSPPCNIYYTFALPAPSTATSATQNPYSITVANLAASASINIPSAATTDPWGNAIQYTVDTRPYAPAANPATYGVGRVATGTGPYTILITSDPNATGVGPTLDASIAFILTSAGPDGAFSTTDDIVLTVYVGDLRSQSLRY